MQDDRAKALDLLAVIRKMQPQSPDIRAQLANLELWAGDGEAAMAEYRALLELEPGQQTYLRGFVDAAASVEELTEKDAAFLRPIAEKSAASGTDVLFLARLANVLYSLEEFKLSNRVLDRAMLQAPPDPKVRKQLAGALAANGRYKEAIAQYQGVTLHVDQRQELGRLYEAIGDFAGAAAQYRLVLKDHPRNKAALERLGQVLTWNKDFPGAIVAYEQLAKIDPKNPDWLLRVAELNLWSNEGAASLTAYTQLLEKDANQPKLWQGFVDAAGLTPRLEPAHAKVAKRVGKEVLERPGNDPVFLSRLAWVLVKSGATADATAILDRAAALKPEEPAVRKEMAGVFASVGKFREAIKLFEGLDLTFADRLRLVEFYNGARDFVSAEAETRKLLKMRPDDPKIELLLAEILGWQGRHLEAAEMLRKLRQIEPDSPALAARLARAEAGAHNFDAALKQFADLLAANPDQPALWGDFVAAASAAPTIDSRYRKMLVDLADKTLADRTAVDPQFLSQLAQALRTLKEMDKSTSLLKRAVAADPTSRPLKLQYAQTLYDAGRFAEAKVYFTELLP
jgi:tetratricopeptide (TPR) repeat protein